MARIDEDELIEHWTLIGGELAEVARSWFTTASESRQDQDLGGLPRILAPG